jgi:hypothetical protein
MRKVMKESFLKEKINELLLFDSVALEEYQNKFYFVKNLKILFPEIPETTIYKAIDYTNENLQPPRKKKEYINLLINKLLNFHT